VCVADGTILWPCAPHITAYAHWLNTCCWWLQAAEYTAIREELYFLRPLKRKLAGILFWMVVLLWFQVRFKSGT
jgi:hypothetical protein